MSVSVPQRGAVACVVLLLAMSLLSSCFGPASALQLVDNAAEAMGGWVVLDAMATHGIRTRGTDWEPLQTVSPDAEPRQVNTFEQNMLVDYRKPRLRIEFNSNRLYPTQANVQFTEIIDGDVGTLDGSNERLHPSRLAARLRDYNRLPFRLLYTAKAAKDLARAEDRTVDGKLVHLVTYTDGVSPVELHFDPDTGLPVRVIYMEDDPVWGDTANELAFTEWEYDAGARLPKRTITRLNGKKIREEFIRGLSPNPPISEAQLAIPAEVRSAPENGERIVSQWTLRRASIGVAYLDFARPQRVEIVDVAPGVFHLRGASHHSMVVEMKDHLVVIEAPLFEERSVAILKALDERFPGKPVRYLGITHFHFDHTGGIRAFAARGATLLAPASIVPFVNDVLHRPHKLKPDSLAKQQDVLAPPQLHVEGVDQMKVLSDGSRSVELRAVPNEHAEGMLVAYLPNEKVVFVSDMYSPPGPVPNPSVIFERERANAFYRYLIDNKLEVRTIVGGHGGVGPLQDLAKAIAAK